uniref:BY PROTMAP: gi/647394756/emb/CDR35990.1/ RHTO0S01e11694g1_1 [Rhodosporidium toruloides] n=1 Tax=Rhodotorula toruloides TaxID=5286 RepID=A0A0K3C9N5_RHOTO
MAGRAPPPSFSSFPDLSKPRQPPSFSSFPSPPRPSTSKEDSPPPAKRHRAADFLDELEEELGIDDRRKGQRREETRSRRSEEEDRTTKTPHDLVLATLSADSTPGPAQLSEPAVPDTDKPVFYESRRGDPNNLRYGGLHRGDVPKYRRVGAGKVIGLNDGLRITRETAYSGRGVEIAPVNRFKTPRYVDPASLRHLTDKNAKRLILRPAQPKEPRAVGAPGTPPAASFDPFQPSADENGLTTEYVALERERTTAEKLDKLEHEEGTDYRSIAGLVKSSDLAESSDDEEADDLFGGLGISGGESHADYLKRRNLELDRALRDDPSNVDKWIEFVDFQDEVAQSSFVGASASSAAKRALSKAERASTSEIKLAILERALAHPGNANSERLILAQLRAANDIEDPKRVLERWKEALMAHPDLTGLWIEYVSWRQTTWSTFNVKDVVDVFEESFVVLGDAMSGEEAGSSAREMLEANAVYLLLRFCLMLRQAGFSERALATFQAIVELNLFRPADFDRLQYERFMPWKQRVLAAFESFWDAEAPRIGETGAKGWRSTTDEDMPPEAVPASDVAVVEAQREEGARPHERWARAERIACESHRPARTTDPSIDDSDDPYRVVLFDDIRPFLFFVDSPDSRLQLAYAFLTFLGLPFVPPDVPTSTPFTTDPFIHSELVERPSLIQRFWPSGSSEKQSFGLVGGEPMELERKSDIKEPWQTPFKAAPAMADLLFGSGKAGWFRTLVPEDLQDVDVELAKNALNLLRTVSPDIFLTLDAFSLETAQSPKSAVKLAKQVLRDKRQDLALWDGYARIERSRGKVADARQVYCTALSMYRSFTPQDQVDGPLLWRAWAEMEWEEDRPALALRILVAATSAEKVDLASLAAMTDVERPSPATLLRARQYYTRELEASFQPRATQALLRNRNHLAFSLALFEYVSRGLSAAVDVLEQHLLRLDGAGASGTAEHEESFVLYAKLLFRHSSRGKGYKPGQLRELLDRALQQYKYNTLFLSLAYHNELRMKIQNHFRLVMEEKVLKENEATSESWLFAIVAELHLDARRPNIWAVRNLFDRALDNPNTKSSPSLWTLYIDFEVRNGELHRAKSLIYRAIRECPWCKEFYLRPFSPALRSVYRSRELRDFHHLLLEKGLRVRVDIEPFLEGAVTSDMEDDEEEEGEGPMLEDAGEALLAERRRLMPY